MTRKLSILFPVVAVALLASQAAFAAGAVAVNPRTGAWGEAHHWSSPGGAAREALRQCGGGCTVPQTFWGTCMSLALDRAPGSHLYSWAVRPRFDQATGAAINECGRSGGRACQRAVTVCD